MDSRLSGNDNQIKFSRLGYTGLAQPTLAMPYKVKLRLCPPLHQQLYNTLYTRHKNYSALHELVISSRRRRYAREFIYLLIHLSTLPDQFTMGAILKVVLI
jgi:hypothetical protein